MDERLDRRRFLVAGVAGLTAALGGCAGLRPADEGSAATKDAETDRGAPPTATATSTARETRTVSETPTASETTTATATSDPTTISYGESVRGSLDEDDPTDPAYDGTYYAEPVTFDGEAGDEIEISMTSDAFDPWLRLAGPFGSTVTDAGERGTDAVVTATLTTDGEYVIWSGAFDEERTGAYALTVEKTGETTPTTAPAETDADLRSLAYGDTAAGFVDPSDPIDPEYGGEYHAEPITFDGESGDEIEIAMESDAFDPWLRLENPAGETVAEDDDGASGTDARLTATLESSGEFTVWAQPYSENRTGAYAVTLERTN